MTKSDWEYGQPVAPLFFTGSAWRSGRPRDCDCARRIRVARVVEPESKIRGDTAAEKPNIVTLRSEDRRENRRKRKEELHEPERSESMAWEIRPM